jgi:hypothetical protein
MFFLYQKNELFVPKYPRLFYYLNLALAHSDRSLLPILNRSSHSKMAEIKQENTDVIIYCSGDKHSIITDAKYFPNIDYWRMKVYRSIDGTYLSAVDEPDWNSEHLALIINHYDHLSNPGIGPSALEYCPTLSNFREVFRIADRIRDDTITNIIREFVKTTITDAFRGGRLQKINGVDSYVTEILYSNDKSNVFSAGNGVVYQHMPDNSVNTFPNMRLIRNFRSGLISSLFQDNVWIYSGSKFVYSGDYLNPTNINDNIKKEISYDIIVEIIEFLRIHDFDKTAIGILLHALPNDRRAHFEVTDELLVVSSL